MKRYGLLAILVFSVLSSSAQTTEEPLNDTIYTTQLKTAVIRARWRNDTERYHYNQMKFYVTTILPYLNAATKLFTELNTKLQDPNLTRKERKAFISTKEDEMREQFGDKIKDLNVTQGVLLVKLIARQTDMNIYQSLCEFKNPLMAIKWQAWARLNGMNLDRKYHPEEERDLELIMEDLGYPLPDSYALTSR